MSCARDPRSSTSHSHRARATHRVRPKDVSKVLCHREKHGKPEFLVRWRTRKEPPIPPHTIASWHALEELELCLHFVQAYVEGLPTPGLTNDASGALQNASAAPVNQLKRKAPGSEVAARDTLSHASTSAQSGLLTPRLSHLGSSRSPSISSIDSASFGAGEHDWKDVTVYNGILQKREGWFLAKKSKSAKTVTINVAKLPTKEMLEHARATPKPLSTAERHIRQQFMEKVKVVPGLYIENEVDNTTPSLDFTFIDDVVLGKGVNRLDADVSEGCQEPCRPNMGQHIGCEYTAKCKCLEFAAVDKERLKNASVEKYEEYMRQIEVDEFASTEGLPKRFPYRRNGAGGVPTLHPFYREERHPIYECNQNCNCGSVCKSRLVQKGRRVGLTIFKTSNRGWGLRCNEDLIQGEFVDTYLGEVVTNDEAEARENVAGPDKASYMYSLDKFVGEPGAPSEDTCHVVDGQYMGNATRFINHSCEPNCRQYVVSYNRYDTWNFTLAFFAYEDIPVGTELTFDYMDKDEEEEEDVLRKRQAAAEDPANLEKRPCNCGANKCRGYLWV